MASYSTKTVHLAKSLFPTQSIRPRRPLVFIASSYISGIAFCYLFSPPLPALIISLMTFSTLFVYVIFRDFFLSVFTLLICVAFFSGAVYAHTSFSKTDSLEIYMTDGAGYVEGIVGRVLFCEQRDEDYKVLTVVTGSRKILVRSYGESEKQTSFPPEQLIGKRVLMKGKLSYPGTVRNPKGFDYRLHLLSRNIRVILTCELPGDFELFDSASEQIGLFQSIRNENAIEKTIWNTLGVLARAKATFANNVYDVLPASKAALFLGMMFGDKEALDEDTYDLFKRHGVAHILSVSGLHIGMVYAFVSATLGNRKTKRFYIAAIILLLCYAAISNFSPTVMRAFSMITVHIVGKVLNQRYDMLTGVLLSAFIMLIINPLALFGTGFILSYTAVCSLAFALPFASRFTGFRNKLSGNAVRERQMKFYGARFSKLAGGEILKLLMPAVIIQVFMLPLTMYFFNNLPVLAVLINIPVIALASLIVPFGIVILIISVAGSIIPPLLSLTETLSGIGSSSAGAMIDLMMGLTQAADQIAFSSFVVPSPPFPLLMLFYLLGFYLLSDTFAMSLARFRKSYMSGLLALPALIVVCLLIGLSPSAKQNDAAYTFVDVGQGDCLHVKTHDGRNYLMDGGGKYDYNVGKNTLAPYLLQNGVSRLDGIFVSHLHMDHLKGLTELAAIMDIGAVYVFDRYSTCPNAVTQAFTNQSSSSETSASSTSSGIGIFNADTFNKKSSGADTSKADPYSSPSTILENNLRFVAAGDTVTLGKYARAEVLYPEKRSHAEYEQENLYMEYVDEDENLNSLIIRFINKDVSVLMTGDISKHGEEEASVLADLGCDILKIGHHGSKTSTSEALLASASPKIAVIQLGKNTYGHPAPETLETLSSRNIPVYRNDEDGAILIFPVKSGFKVQTVIPDMIPPVLLKQFEKDKTNEP